MTDRIPVNPGTVEWCGDNPGIYLKQDPEGDWSSLAVYFRVTLSPHGRGHTMLLLEQPDSAAGFPDANNLCITDNDALTDYLLEHFIRHFPTFRGRAGIDGMLRLPMKSRRCEGDMKSVYRELMSADGVECCLEWRRLGEPFAVEVTPKDCATGAHDMYSVFFEAGDASISVNGASFDGRVTDRQFFGRTMSTAFLAVSETWVRPRS